MNTWKNNNVLKRIEESYFLEDTDRDEALGLLADARPVGGTIFYIDSDADGIYEFFDAKGNVIEDVEAGDRPYVYRVLKKGSKDKYYVYHDKVYDGNWGYLDKSKINKSNPLGVRVMESLGTSEGLGSGKTNTEKVMNKDGGVYVTKDIHGYPSIWYQLQQVRDSKAGGCDDWFVPSKYEIERLRLAIESGNITGGAVAGSSYNASAFMEYVWSSSEFSAGYTWGWSYRCQCWGDVNRHGRHFVFFTRAF